MSATYEEWEAVNEVLGRYAYCGSLERIEEMAKLIVELEAYITKREEYVEFLLKQLGDAQFDLMMA